MDINKAINLLIERNQSLVNKSGISDYTKTSDEIINTLLNYAHQMTAELSQEKEKNEKSNIILELLGINHLLKIDTEFLSRYLKYDIKTGIEIDLIKNGYIEDTALTISQIEQSYQYYKSSFEHEFEIYLFVKQMYSTLKDYLTKLYPDYCHYIENKYNDNEVKKLIKEKLLYQYE